MSFARTMVQTTFVMWANTLGSVATRVGMVSSLFAVTAMITKLFLGPLMQTYNKKTLLSIAAVMQLIVYAAYGLTVTFGMAAGLRILQGIGHSLAAGAFLAIASESLPKSKMTQGIGVFSVAPMCVTSFAAPTMLFLADTFGWNIAFFLASGIMTLALVVTLFVKYEGSSAAKQPKLSFKRSNIIAPGALLPLAIMAISEIMTNGNNGFVMVYGPIVDPDLKTSIGLYSTVGYWTAFLLTPFITRLCDKMGYVRVAICLVLINACAHTINSFATGLPMFLTAAVLYGISHRPLESLNKALIIKYVKYCQRGVASNTAMLGIDIGSFLGPITAGFLIDIFSGNYAMMFRYWPIICVIALILILAGRCQINRREAEFSVGIV
jgi:predicted MFS family arabinose efflux permease